MPRRVVAAFALALTVAAPTPAAEAVDYLRDVKPTLAARCYACHGALQQKAKLRVDTAKELVASGAVVPGKSGDSPLIAHVLGQGDHARMPPPSEGEALTAQQVAALRRWIDAGATAPPDEPRDPDPREHWAFRTPVRPPAPKLSPQSSVLSTNPVDAFLAAEWAKRGLTPQKPADPRLLLRRVYLDLTGLPPTPDETDAFLKDTSPGAYERLVDRLLASPQYGERWGRHFLDVWRYSDWWGLGAEVRNSQKHIWHWRDWVVESLNADKGYDQMVREMLAADELYPTDPDRLRATGYLARQYFKFNRTTWLDETIEHTAKAFLGLTFNCAKCHDHKYDPIAQNDYYRFRAVFEPYQVRTDMVPGEPDFEKDGIPRAFDCNLDAPTYKHERGDDRRPLTNKTMEPGVPPLLAFAEFKPVPVTLPPFAYQPGARPEIIATHRAVAEKKLAAAKAVRDHFAAKLPGGWAGRIVRRSVDAAAASAEAELAKVEKAAANPADPKFPLRGSLKTLESNLETEASRGKPFPRTSTGRRTALANWVADKRNPLTARVVVNHVWARHFGRPLVATVFDFGRKGAKPTHPELLDWLAVELMEHGWSLKHLHRLIVTSAAYRMSSSAAGAEASAKADPENKSLWRQNPVRMEAQVVRDSLLHLAGKLDRTAGGPSVPPAQQDASTRRSLYFFQSHNEHHKFLSQFDDANVLECYRRTESIVPQQALTLSNSKFALTMADAITRKLSDRLGNVSDESFVTAAFRAVLATTPTADETAACLAALAEWRKLAGGKDGSRPRTNLVSALLNHNDFVTIR